MSAVVPKALSGSCLVTGGRFLSLCRVNPVMYTGTRLCRGCDWLSPHTEVLAPITRLMSLFSLKSFAHFLNTNALVAAECFPRGIYFPRNAFTVRLTYSLHMEVEYTPPAMKCICTYGIHIRVNLRTNINKIYYSTSYCVFDNFQSDVFGIWFLVSILFKRLEGNRRKTNYFAILFSVLKMRSQRLIVFFQIATLSS